MKKATKKEIEKFIESQRSIQFYKKLQTAIFEVLSSMPYEDYKKITKNLIIVSLHLGVEGQAMHFKQTKGNFRIVELIYIKDMPQKVMRYVVAHEFGHISQERNWKQEDGNKLEIYADAKAKEWRFDYRKEFVAWSRKFWKSKGIDRNKY